MPRKISQLIKELKKNGFENRGGKGSHRNFVKGMELVTISGKDGDDAKHYQEKLVKQAIERSKK
ncbi:type II toxin-antitoxin system HicA family toxin [Persicirhabdus sediminis]|uniref:Type II toxin-antitoxin system HicA family toxin n=1 Tax=Persicirhabdus sediminis TaxID=454144 RepID=A0A8J7SKM0_9BACT|nr:type II toxin-antitoxin system HicA family toxin [Persicirhabdus sediminis]MBK1792179.1 type II toxin-antitoxin system HicA family toxin [Persicirhabdus sediminis]